MKDLDQKRMILLTILRDNDIDEDDAYAIGEAIWDIFEQEPFEKPSRLQEVKKVYEEIYDRYETIIPLLGIYAELREFEPELDEDQMEFLIDVAMEIYWNYERSTPTGIGVSIRNMLWTYFDTVDLGEEIDFNDIFTYDNIMDEYEWSDWQ